MTSAVLSRIALSFALRPLYMLQLTGAQPEALKNTVLGLIVLNRHFDPVSLL